MKLNQDALKKMPEKQVKEIIASLNHQEYFQTNPIRGKRHANKQMLAEIMVERVLEAIGQGVKIPKDLWRMIEPIYLTEKPTGNAPEEQMFLFLDDLRESGVTNMYGAAPYLTEEFGLDKKSAKEVLKRWMDTFSDRHRPIVVEEQKPVPIPDPPTPEPEEAPKPPTKPKKVKEPKGLSNKQVVHSLWASGKSDHDALLAAIKNAVKKTTIKSWTSDWKRGVNLPKGAK